MSDEIREKLEKLESALLEGRISEETYKKLRSKYELQLLKTRYKPQSAPWKKGLGIFALILALGLIVILILPTPTKGPEAPTSTPSVSPTPSPSISPTIEPKTSKITWNLVWEYKTDYPIKGVAISSDGNYIIAIGDNYEGGRNDVLYLSLIHI